MKNEVRIKPASALVPLLASPTTSNQAPYNTTTDPGIESTDPANAAKEIHSGNNVHARPSDAIAHTPNISKLEAGVDSGHIGPFALTLPVKAGAENRTSGVASPDDLEMERRLAYQIKWLWSSDLQNSSTTRIHRRLSESNRKGLAECLAAYNQLLIRAGRDGSWADFLRKMDIPPTRADRYIEKWRLSTVAAIDEPSQQDIADLLKKVTARARRVLTTDESIAQFLLEIAAALQTPVSSA